MSKNPFQFLPPHKTSGDGFLDCVTECDYSNEAAGGIRGSVPGIEALEIDDGSRNHLHSHLRVHHLRVLADRVDD